MIFGSLLIEESNGSMEEIRVISTSTVTPTMADKVQDISSSRVELTPWDLPPLLIEGIQKGLVFFNPPLEQEQGALRNNLIDHLKNSLARTLDFFPPLAGRLATIENDDNTKSFFIDCNNKGVEFTHATVHGLKVANILDPIYVPVVVQSFFPLNRVTNIEGISKPLLAVQVTELDDGIFIGCTMNHSVADGTCFWHFFNSWSEISRGFSCITKSPIFNRWFPDNATYPIHIPLRDEQILEKFIPPPTLERVFHFSKQNIARLKMKANSEIGCEKISSLQALLAHLWQSVIRCRSLESNQEVTFKLPMGTRTRFDPPLPDGYFGNALQIGAVTTTSDQLLKNGLGWAAREMSKLVEQTTSEITKKSYEDWIKTPKLFVLTNNVVNSLILSSSPRFNVYGTNFGWGKPLAVKSGLGNKFDGKITIFPGFEEGSIDLEVCLSPQTMHALGKDAEFMKSVTT